MELEDQCCTLEQAKKLWQLGLRKKCYYSYCAKAAIKDYEFQDYKLISLESLINEYHLPAPTVSELGQMLPRMISELDNDLGIDDMFSDHYQFWIRKTGKNEWLCGYEHTETQKWIVKFTDKNMAVSMADCLIWLLDQKLLTAQQINEAA